MTTPLVNQCILITGASSGIGTSCAHFFAQAGARLILAARRREKLDALSD
ncbi:MAG: SDR family NAD(P)-dependent oxidoreductase, partial [Cyanobacteria bacterium J06638_6]